MVNLFAWMVEKELQDEMLILIKTDALFKVINKTNKFLKVEKNSIVLLLEKLNDGTSKVLFEKNI